MGALNSCRGMQNKAANPQLARLAAEHRANKGCGKKDNSPPRQPGLPWAEPMTPVATALRPSTFPPTGSALQSDGFAPDRQYQRTIELNCGRSPAPLLHRGSRGSCAIRRRWTEQLKSRDCPAWKYALWPPPASEHSSPSPTLDGNSNKILSRSCSHSHHGGSFLRSCQPGAWNDTSGTSAIHPLQAANQWESLWTHWASRRRDGWRHPAQYWNRAQTPAIQGMRPTQDTEFQVRPGPRPAGLAAR